MSCFYLRQSGLRKDLSPRLKLNLFRHGSRFRMSHRCHGQEFIGHYISFSPSDCATRASRASETQLVTPPAGSTSLPLLSHPRSPEISKVPVGNFGNGSLATFQSASSAVSISAHGCRGSPSASGALVRVLYYTCI